MSLISIANQVSISSLPSPLSMSPGFSLAKYFGRVTYHVELEGNALAGLMFITCSWKRRDGTPQSHTSVGLNLLTGTKLDGDVLVYLEDNPNADVTVTFSTVGVLGTYQFSYWASFDAELGA